MSVKAFKTGDRVKFSDHGLDALAPRKWNRRGSVVGNPQNPNAKLVHVKWDDTRAIYGISYHPSFIELTPQPDWDADIVELSPAAFTKFVDAIENPKPPNDALIKLMTGQRW